MSRTPRLAVPLTAVLVLSALLVAPPASAGQTGDPEQPPQDAPASAPPAHTSFLSVQVATEGPARPANYPARWRVTVRSAGTSAVQDVVLLLERPEGSVGAPEVRGGEQAWECGTDRCTAATLQPGTTVLEVSQLVGSAGTHVLRTALVPREGDDPADDAGSAPAEVAPALPTPVLSVEPVPGPVVHGSEVHVRAVLRGPSHPGARRVEVDVERRLPDGEWERFGSESADLAAGQTEARVGVHDTVRQRAEYRWSFAGDDVWGPAAPVVQLVRPVVQPVVTTDPVRLPPGGSGAVVAEVRGPVQGRTLVVQQLSGGTWVELARRALTGPGTVRVPLRSLPAGSHRYRALVLGEDSLASAERVLPVTLAGRGDPRAFTFMGRVAGGRPARWNPCTPIRFAVNAAQAPPGGVADLTEALRRVSQATGLVFRSAGRTTSVPQTTRSPRFPAPLVIVWTSMGSLGYGEARWGETGRIDRGLVRINSDADLTPGFGSGLAHGSVLMHEIAHAVGLDHVSSRYQVMQPQLTDKVDAAVWGAGDLAGLKRVGRGAGCLA